MTMASSGPVLECSGLTKSFGDHAVVKGLGFSVAPGETYGLLGPNGAGKTTTISMIAGLLEPDVGEIRLAGEPMNPDATHTKRLVGLVPQDLAIYPDLDAAENLEFFGRLQGMKGTDLKRRVAEVLEIIELTDRAEDRTEQYSGGMKRRLNIGVGLLHQPALLILDEPTVGVDPQSRNAILDSVERLGEEGMAVLYTTHYMEEAERLCDRIGIVDQGQLIAEGTQADLVRIVGQKDRLTLTATGSLAATASALSELEAVDDAGVTGEAIVLIVDRAHDHLPRILEIAGRTGSMVKSVDVDSADLESVFLKLTGRALRE
ncbi:MAG: ABC transporter ATP-binding protein [Acidimicrobiia bacterium]|nr:ABC transporter ATP-binding protein [Acidimicrobiia bacterium]MDH4309416.1 ABC transporter ATP-binding protein [Acidimicrobiia bacterium]